MCREARKDREHCHSGRGYPYYMTKNIDFKVKLSVKLVGLRSLRYIKLTGRTSKLEKTVLNQYCLACKPIHYFLLGMNHKMLI